MHPLPSVECLLQCVCLDRLPDDVNPYLPKLTASEGKICYFFDTTQTCSGQAISVLLGLPAVTDIPNWTPTYDDCGALLMGQRIYAETVATSLSDVSITSAGVEGVTDYELMLQSWVLRVGRHQLETEHAAFTAVLNRVTDWTTVKCEKTNLLHDGATTALPAFVGPKDCAVLSAAFPDPCDSTT